ncbi:MAG TPA: caspase family protein [Thermoanaerobaculia bacterium]|nr:caspase family protein [Thermoanaerobaculia bacterium]
MHRRVSWFVVLACAAVSLYGAAPKLRKTVVIPISLPANYQPASLPSHPIDEELRIGIVPPAFDAAKNATWNSAAHYEGKSIWAMTITEIDRIILNFAEPIANTLPQVLRRAFPKTEILSGSTCATCDLILRVEVHSGVFEAFQARGRVTVTAVITAVASDGTILTMFSAEGSSRITKSMYWSDNTMARAVGVPALQQVLEQIGATLTRDPVLSTYLKRKEAEHARPSELETSVTFDDANSLLPNGRLDAGEEATLHITVHNRGTGPAFRVRAQVASTTLRVPAETSIGDVAAGATRTVDIPVTAGLDVSTGQQQVRIETIEQRGYGGRPVLFGFPTAALIPPTLEIADVRLDDQAPHGDGDGRPANGETVDAVILVRNSGPGEATGATLTLTGPPGVTLTPAMISVARMPAKTVTEVRTHVRIPITFPGPRLALHLRATETRGATVATAERASAWDVEDKRPNLDIAYRLYDGDSPTSRGNRDGIANNGETVELALVPVNHGNLAARDVQIRIAVPGLDPLPSTFDVGNLPAQAEAPEHRLRLTLPRVLALSGPLPVKITSTQADFPPTEQILALPFRAQQPRLVTALTSLSPLVEGTRARFAIDMRNDGALNAEDVEVDIACDNSAVELLDNDGAPVHTLHLKIGAIPAQATTGRVMVHAHLRRNPANIVGLLKATVTQRDYTATAAQLPLTIATEAARVIAAPPPPPQTAAPPSLAAPATISFQRFRDGSRIPDETVAFPFEVQSTAPLEVVRLEQNHRAIELPLTTPARTDTGYVWSFEPQVHLDYGPNEFEVIVITMEGTRNTRSITLDREKPRGAVWLAVVGVSQYQDAAVPNLQFATEDASAISAYYHGIGVPSDHITELLNEQATLPNIKRRLGTDLVRNATNPDDLVILYFAGHGEMEGDRSSADADGYSKYLLPHDTNAADLFGSALSMEELSRILQRLRPERVVLLIDTCFSGAAGGRTPYEPNAPARGVISEEYLARIANAGKGRIIITASGSHEVAQESTAIRHGVFTYYLLEGLRGAADQDHDGKIDVDELYKYVSQKVSTATHGRQNPMRKAPNTTGSVIIGGRLQ